jgi:hypothetical protein
MIKGITRSISMADKPEGDGAEVQKNEEPENRNSDSHLEDKIRRHNAKNSIGKESRYEESMKFVNQDAGVLSNNSLGMHETLC